MRIHLKFSYTYTALDSVESHCLSIVNTNTNLYLTLVLNPVLAQPSAAAAVRIFILACGLMFSPFIFLGCIQLQVLRGFYSSLL